MPQHPNNEEATVEMTEKRDFRIAYTVVERSNGGKKYWVRIGAAFENRDGSINIRLDAVPTNGQIQLRDYEPQRQSLEKNAA